MTTKIEHNGAKHGKGYWGTKGEAKARSRSLRRAEAKRLERVR